MNDLPPAAHPTRAALGGQRSALSALASFALAAAGCAAPSTPATAVPEATPTEPRTPAEVYFPLRDDTVYRYATKNRTGRDGQLVMQVQREGRRAQLETASKVQQLEIRSDGIYNTAGFYLLELPLELGNEWPGKHGTVKITHARRVVQVPAGRFEGCLTTTETSGAALERRAVVTTFCPDAGIVELHVEAHSSSGVERESALLEYFGPKIDIDAL